MKCISKHKESLHLIKYTKDTQSFILSLLGDRGELDPLNRGNSEIRLYDWYGGDILNLNEYLGNDNKDFFVADELMNRFKSTNTFDDKGFEIWEEEKAKEFEYIQWTDKNTEECLNFLNHQGGLDGSKHSILIMTSYGGSVCNKNDYILKRQNEYFTVTSEYFNREFEIVESKTN